MKSVNPWDELSRKEFDTNVPQGAIDPKAADNILIAWPPIIKLIKEKFPDPEGVRVLDFGCGTGGFCNRLKSEGFEVSGIDTSTGMIETAKSHSPDVIHYLASGSSSLKSMQKFRVIVSIMTFPFIENLEDDFRNLIDSLDSGGLLLLADFNRKWVSICLKKGVSFKGFDSQKNPKSGMKVFGDLKIPVYIRDSKFYDRLAKKSGMEKILEEYPPFTDDFKKNYPDGRPLDIPEYLILGYRKIS